MAFYIVSKMEDFLFSVKCTNMWNESVRDDAQDPYVVYGKSGRNWRHLLLWWPVKVQPFCFKNTCEWMIRGTNHPEQSGWSLSHVVRWHFSQSSVTIHSPGGTAHFQTHTTRSQGSPRDAASSLESFSPQPAIAPCVQLLLFRFV